MWVAIISEGGDNFPTASSMNYYHWASASDDACNKDLIENKKDLLRERKRHTARKRAQDADRPPLLTDTPHPRRLDLNPPPAGWTWPLPPTGWTWPPPAGWTWPLPVTGWTWPPPAGWTWPPLSAHWPDPPPLAHWPDPPPGSLTWTLTPAGPDSPTPAGPDSLPAGWTWLPPSWLDLTPPCRLTDLTPPTCWTWPPPPPGVDRQTKWNYYLPVVLCTWAVTIKSLQNGLQSNSGVTPFVTDRVRSTMARLCFDMSVCLSTPGEGAPARSRRGWGREVPHLRYPSPSDLAHGGTLMGGTPPQVPPHQAWWGVPQWGVPILGTPQSGLMGGTPTGGYPIRPGRGYPPSDLAGGRYPTSGSTWYAAVGMPLAFTQEDFLVSIIFNERSIASVIAASILRWRRHLLKTGTYVVAER